MVPGIVYSWSWTILLDELEMYQFFAILSINKTVFDQYSFFMLNMYASLRISRCSFKLKSNHA